MHDYELQLFFPQLALRKLELQLGQLLLCWCWWGGMVWWMYEG
jgi:hypothetical protein